MTTFPVSIEDAAAGSSAVFSCPDTVNVLEGMEHAHLSTISVGCRRGGCGVCRVHVIAGTYESKRMSKAHVSEEDQARHVVLACRIMPTSDLRVEPLGLAHRPEVSTTSLFAPPSPTHNL